MTYLWLKATIFFQRGSSLSAGQCMAPGRERETPWKTKGRPAGVQAPRAREGEGFYVPQRRRGHPFQAGHYGLEREDLSTPSRQRNSPSRTGQYGPGGRRPLDLLSRPRALSLTGQYMVRKKEGAAGAAMPAASLPWNFHGNNAAAATRHGMPLPS